MSASSEFEPVARQDYGPATTSESTYQCLLDPKLEDMSIPTIRPPVLRAVGLSPNKGDPEPDSTNPEGILHTLHGPNLKKEIKYHISKKNVEMPLETLSGIVRIEEGTLDPTGHISYPIITETDDSNDANYMESSGATIIHAHNAAFLQNVGKLPQNFTINVDATVGNVATIQNISQDVSGGSQTLWLPTILATSAPTPVDKTIDDDRSQSGVSQIIIASDAYDNQNAPRRTNIVSDANSYITRTKNSKVQILSNISLPKNSTYSQQYIASSEKDMVAPVYGTQNHVFKLSTSVSQKHVNNSVVSNKTNKNQSLVGSSKMPQSVINSSSPVKNVTYSNTIPKGPNLHKTLNKVNNGANLNALVAASSGNTQCHILSRVVSGPNKVGVHHRKSTSGSKGTKTIGSNTQKGQSRSIKIIQQTGAPHKNESKNWSSSSTYKSQSSYSTVDTNSSKVIQKVGSPTHKNHHHVAALKVPSKGDRLVLQSQCGSVIVSTAPMSTSYSKAPHYVQSGPTPNLRYVQTYGTVDSSHHSNLSQMTANQQLTAQILQSLSQPKAVPAIQSVNDGLQEKNVDMRPVNQKRFIFGDPTTPSTADDILGIEERPNLSEELLRYSFQTLAIVMLDHTYALPGQKQPTSNSPPVESIAASTIVSPKQVTAPLSPMKGSTSVITSTAPYDMQPLSVPTSVVGSAIPVSSIQMGALTYKSQAHSPLDDDTASVISSIEGDRRRDDLGGSDTETAPEEEEGKTRCICDFTHDDGFMICCDRCGEWQHVDCMGIDRNNIPDAYMCELCLPRTIDRRHARSIQQRKREELSALGASDTDSSEGNRFPGQRRKRLLTVTTYTNTSSSCVSTYNSQVPALPPLPLPSVTLQKRGPKRLKKPEIIRKGNKRKLSEKRVKLKKEMMMNRSKYNSSMSNQSHWQESYELAMTNHYSPELRAKIIKYSSKLGNAPNMSSAITAHLCTTVPHAGGKILIAIRDLKESTPVIELRGKYMLSNQHRPPLQNSARAGSQKPGPFVFFYRLPKDNTQVCIDTRTYGNEARFVRRSCKPNAELQHCIIKGALHVYVATIGIVQSNTEITVGHDLNGAKQPCACGNPKHCKVNGLSSIVSRKSCEYPSREKRMRNRCTSSSSPASPPPAPVISTPPPDYISSPCTPFKVEKKSPVKQELKPMLPLKHNNGNIMALQFDECPKIEQVEKEEKTPVHLEIKEEPKPKIEELVIESPPKVEESFLEEAIVKKEEVELPVEVKDEIKEEAIEMKEEEVVPPVLEEKQQPKAEEPVKEEVERVTRNSVLAKSACHDRSSRSSRNTSCFNLDSLDDKTDDSQDKVQAPSTRVKDKNKMTREERKMEAILKAIERMEKAEQKKQEVKDRQKRRESDPVQPTMDKDEDEDSNSNRKRKKRKGRARTTSQNASSNRHRLDSVDSDMVTSGDEASTGETHLRHSLDDSDARHSVSEDLGLSSACLLVEAAVGSVESAFKLPKTKKTMATEWIGRSPERTPSPYHSPYRPSLVTATSLESLVRVASTMIGDLSGSHLGESESEEMVSPPRTPGRDRNKPPKKARRVTRNTTPTDVAEVTPSALPQHSAKKRWLRQAISEESDSPTAESPPNEMITPLKKRRLARESLSCEQSIIVPCNEESSPHLTCEDSPIKDYNRTSLTRQCKMRNILESMYGDRDRSRSESGHGSDDQCHIDASNDVLNVNLKEPHDTENIRRIIGVPNPEDIEQIQRIPKPEEISIINNNIGENATSYNIYSSKVVPMDIDTSITPQIKMIDCNEGSNNETIREAGSPNDKVNSSQSADTSGNSSPQRNEMDDIQKKIHSFHTENILMLKSRNKKPPKEKRKKVNLNFDLNMVDDQISIQLRTEHKSPEVNGDIHDDSSPMANSVDDDPTKLQFVLTENIPLPPVESIPLPAPENIPLPEESMAFEPPPEDIPLPEEPMVPKKINSPPVSTEVSESVPLSTDKPTVDNPESFKSKFSSTGLFSGIFSNVSQSLMLESPQINENVPNMQIIKNVIDRTAYLEKSLFDKETITPDDEFKSVQKILTRVSNMDSNNSVILSGVLKSSDDIKLSTEEESSKSATKLLCLRSNDPRLNPPPVDKPKPVRRKLSISEYRKRHKGCPPPESEANSNASATCAMPSGVWSSSSSSSGAGSLSPLRLDSAATAAADDLEQRLHRALNNASQPKGVFDAQPTSAERVREKLSSRLRREFGLALPDDDDARPPTALQDSVPEERTDR